jgi:hypothetical protein
MFDFCGRCGWGGEEPPGHVPPEDEAKWIKNEERESIAGWSPFKKLTRGKGR